MNIEIAPALEPEEWRNLRKGCIAIERVFDEMHVVVTDPDGEVVSVSGPQELFALIALANEALPNGDPRKITRDLCDRLRVEKSAAEEVADLFDKVLSPPSKGRVGMRDSRAHAREATPPSVARPADPDEDLRS